MRALVLCALLLTAPATAQVSPATPSPVSTPAPVLTLRAPVGTTVEQRLTVSSRLTVKEVKVEALPGQRLSAQEAEGLRQSVLNAMSSETSQQTGKVFTRVTSRSADGRVGLLQTFIQKVPGQREPITFRITQTVTPQGQSEGLKVTSDNPMLNEVFSRMNLDEMQKMSGQNSGAQATYGQPLVPGHVQEQSAEVPMQPLLNAVFGTLMSDVEGGPEFGAASPLKVVSRTTYTGLTAAGLHAFQTQGQFSDWRFELGEPLPLRAALLNATISGTQTYRPDGLPGPAQTTTHMTMQMSMTGAKDRTTVTFEQEQTVSTQNR